MKKEVLMYARAALIAVVAFAGVALPVAAQNVVQQPQFVQPRTVLDVGNGPTEILPVLGNFGIFTMQSSGLGGTNNASSVTLTLLSTPLVAPCAGCIVTGVSVATGVTITNYSATALTMNLAQAVTTATGSTLSWGAACPVSTQAAPVQPPQSAVMAFIQPGVPANVPLYTQARICAYGGTGPGGQFFNFAIGAH